jgi:hypothetical protein
VQLVAIEFLHIVTEQLEQQSLKHALQHGGRRENERMIYVLFKRMRRQDSRGVGQMRERVGPCGVRRKQGKGRTPEESTGVRRRGSRASMNTVHRLIPFSPALGCPARRCLSRGVAAGFPLLKCKTSSTGSAAVSEPAACVVCASGRGTPCAQCVYVIGPASPLSVCVQSPLIEH